MESRTKFNTILSYLLGAYFFFLAIPHTPAAKYTLLVAILLAVFIGVINRNFKFDFSNGLLICSLLFLIWSALSTSLSPYASESFQAFRKEYLPPLLLILLTTPLLNTSQERIYAIKAVVIGYIAGFFCRTALALWSGAIVHDFIFSPYSDSEFFSSTGALPKYVDFYAIDVSLYLPVVATFILYQTKNAWAKLALTSLTITAYLIILLSGVRSAFLAASIGLALIGAIRFFSAKRLVFATCALVVLFLALPNSIRNSTEFQRYADLANISSYNKSSGMSGRYPLWAGTYELVKYRPLFGWGPGWQKAPQVAQDLKLPQKWADSDELYAREKIHWFTFERGKTNPHNLLVQLMFEVGWVGAILYFLLLATLATTAFKITGSKTCVFKKTTLAFVPSYLVLIITNGIFFPSTLILLIFCGVLFSANSTKEFS